MTQTEQLLRNAILFEEMKKHLISMMDQLDLIMSDMPDVASLTFARQYVSAAKFAKKGLGRKYSTRKLEQWIEKHERYGIK